MAMFQRQSGVQRLQQRADPQLLLTNRILQMSAMELRQCVTQELDENPALESVEEQGCGNCDNPALQCVDCPHGPRLRPLTGEREALRAAGAGEREDELDPLARVAAQCTLQEHLLTQLRAALSDPEDLRIGRYLVESLDDDGYLRGTAEDAAAALQALPGRVERLIGVIQGFEPSGVGARSLQECLLIQARQAAADGRLPDLVEPILTDYWRELISSKWREIARRLRVSQAQVEAAVEWLRHNLSPYPGSQYRPSWQKSPDHEAHAIRPDARILVGEDGRFVVELAREELPAIYVSPHYAALWQRLRVEPESFTPAERRHIRDYLLRAQMFLKGLQDRTSILRQVAECILSEQETYLLTEREEDMRPLTQSQLASFLRVHESTVSRAVAEKFIQLPSGRVVPMSHFFDRALSHRKLVANIVASENPNQPYSDQEISDLLCRQGVQIARRTVMKYREEMNILSSRRRARARA
jgi:RNA polymerase sigma-54 factor